MTNRTPRPDEARAGFQYFLALRRIFPEARLVAAGRIAETMLASEGIEHLHVRHPAHGGKTEFQSGLLAIARER